MFHAWKPDACVSNYLSKLVTNLGLGFKLWQAYTMTLEPEKGQGGQTFVEGHWQNFEHVKVLNQGI